MLEVRGLHKSYGKITALAGVDLSVQAGEIVGLLGPNGAGKTTLVSCVAGLLRPDAGEVRVAGIDVGSRGKEAAQYIGLAPQELGIYPVLTVRDNLRVFGELAGLRGRELARRTDEVAEILHLGEFFDRQAGWLSGGEKRRVHTAIALLHRPGLLLLDEPTTGVDVRTRADVLEAVRGLAAEGAAICYSTHYLTEVEQLGASVAIIDTGRIIAAGPLAELVAAHGTAGVELTFDGPSPTVSVDGLRAEVSGDRLYVGSTEPEAAMRMLLGALGADAARLRSVDVVRPSLESVFFALTGRRYEEETDTDEEEAVDVAPA